MELKHNVKPNDLKSKIDYHGLEQNTSESAISASIKHKIDFFNNRVAPNLKFTSEERRFFPDGARLLYIKLMSLSENNFNVKKQLADILISFEKQKSDGAKRAQFLFGELMSLEKELIERRVI